MQRDIYSSWWYKVLTFILSIIADIHWNGLRAFFNHGVYYDLKERDHEVIRSILKKKFCVILIRRKTHLTTYFIAIIGLFLYKKFGYWSHALLNVETEDPVTDDDYRLTESTEAGVHYSTFMEVFDCDSVLLLEPVNATKEEWESIMAEAIQMIGTPYDNDFNLKDASHVSCVEYILQAAKHQGLDQKVFPDLLKLIEKYNNLDPSMYAMCTDFKTIYEVKY